MFIPSPSSTTPKMVALTRAQARLVWSLLAGLVAVAVVAAIFGASVLPAKADPEHGRLFLILAAVFVPVDLAVGYFVASRIRTRPAPSMPSDAIAGTQVIVGCAVAVGASLLCCVFYFVGREPLVLLLVFPCVAMLLRWFPSEARWAALAPAPAPGAPPRNPMVRE
jgi:hypothetical protein